MYKEKKATNIRIEDVINKINGVTPSKRLQHKPTSYCKSDVKKAKDILNNLLSMPSRTGVSSIRVVPKEIDEE